MRVGIAYMLTGEAAQAVNALRQRYDPQTAAIIDAHVTLAGPSETATPLAEMVDTLRRCAVELLPFDLTIGGVSTFLPVSRACFLEIEPRERLVALHDRLMSEFGWTEQQHFHPHVTITEYLSASETETVAAQLRTYAPTLKDRLSSLSFFYEETEERWNLAAQIPLGGDR
jgi:2'-5' RNA ligase